MLKKSIIIGIISSLVPIFLMSNSFRKSKKCSVNGYSLPQTIMTLPIMFIIINVIALPLFARFKINNYFIIGAILSVVYSSIGRYNKVPQNVFKINPNKFQLNALILWTIYYGIVINYLIN